MTYFPSQAQLESDKVLHFGAGALSGAVGAGIAHKLSDGDRLWTFTGAVSASLLAGLVKEAIDEKMYNGWDNQDLGATVLGGISIGITIDLFSKKRKRKKRSTVGVIEPTLEDPGNYPELAR